MVQEFEFTRASSKGQVVIPRKIRKKLGLEEGSVLAVTTDRDMIVLKMIDSTLTQQNMHTLRLVEEAWKDIEKGRYRVRSKNEFFEELKYW
jgi:AbrB family looped-hinge helix DNA binding protein